jgi:hypothetical protein
MHAQANAQRGAGAAARDAHAQLARMTLGGMLALSFMLWRNENTSVHRFRVSPLRAFRPAQEQRNRSAPKFS